MRSRSRTYSLTFSIYSLILFNSLALHASEYLISYRYVVKDSALYNESLSISQAMKKCSGSPQIALELQTDGNKNLKKIISQNSEKFTEYIHKLGMHVEYKDTTNKAMNKSTTIMTLQTTCFTVDFNDNFAKIAPLK